MTLPSQDSTLELLGRLRSTVFPELWATVEKMEDAARALMHHEQKAREAAAAAAADAAAAAASVAAAKAAAAQHSSPTSPGKRKREQSRGGCRGGKERSSGVQPTHTGRREPRTQHRSPLRPSDSNQGTPVLPTRTRLQARMQLEQSASRPQSAHGAGRHSVGAPDSPAAAARPSAGAAEAPAGMPRVCPGTGGRYGQAGSGMGPVPADSAVPMGRVVGSNVGNLPQGIQRLLSAPAGENADRDEGRGGVPRGARAGNAPLLPLEFEVGAEPMEAETALEAVAGAVGDAAIDRTADAVDTMGMAAGGKAGADAQAVSGRPKEPAVAATFLLHTVPVTILGGPRWKSETEARKGFEVAMGEFVSGALEIARYKHSGWQTKMNEYVAAFR